MNTKLFIADKIKVGFNPRTDTYTGLLGYVIGFDGKKWRKEPSWEGWRYHFQDGEEFEAEKRRQFNQQLENYKRNYEYYKNSGSSWWTKERLEEFENSYDTFQPSGRFSNDPKIKPVEFENIPTEGFVLNKKVGGYRSSWNTRATYSRVYDPRGFEFEITIPNLLFILQECNAYKGKGLEGTFVYAWDGKDLVLLPTSSQEYQESQKFTKLQAGKVGVKDLVAGCSYKTKQLEEYIYLGKFNWFEESYDYSAAKDRSLKLHNVDKRHVFINVKDNRFLGTSSLTSFAQRMTETPVENYAELLDKFNATSNSGVLKEVKVEEYTPETEVSYYGRNATLGTVYLPISDNKFEVYDVDCNRGDWRNSNRSTVNVASYNLTMNRIVSLKDDGDFEIKKVTSKKLDKVSHSTLVDMKLKVLKTNKNNIERKLVF